MPTGALLAASKIKRKYAKSAKSVITKNFLKQDKDLSKKSKKNKRSREKKSAGAVGMWQY